MSDSPSGKDPRLEGYVQSSDRFRGPPLTVDGSGGNNELAAGVDSLRTGIQTVVKDAGQAAQSAVKTIGEGVEAIQRAANAMAAVPPKVKEGLDEAGKAWREAPKRIEKTTSFAKNAVEGAVEGFNGFIKLLDSFGPAASGVKPDKETTLAQNTPAPRVNAPAP